MCSPIIYVMQYLSFSHSNSTGKEMRITTGRYSVYPRAIPFQRQSPYNLELRGGMDELDAPHFHLEIITNIVFPFHVQCSQTLEKDVEFLE